MSNSPNSTTADFAERLLAPLGVALLLLLVSVLAYLFARKRHRVAQLYFDETDATAIDEDEVDEDEYLGISEETMRSFPKFAYSRLAEFVTSGEERGYSSPRSCSICLQEYEESDVIQMLPVCDHFFHKGCVDRWLRRHPTCPICRIALRRSTRFFRLN